MNLRWFTAFAAFSLQLYAGPKVEVHSPQFKGTGCPKESADVSMSANAKQVDLVFKGFGLEADNSLGNSSLSRECEATIRIKVPHGFSVAIQRVRYLGIYDIPFGANAHLIGTHFFNEDEFASFSTRYYGKSEGALSVSAKIPYHNLAWSACGEEAVVSSRTKVMLQASKSVRKASFRIGEDLVASGLSYDLIWRSCQENILD